MSEITINFELEQSQALENLFKDLRVGSPEMNPAEIDGLENLFRKFASDVFADDHKEEKPKHNKALCKYLVEKSFDKIYKNDRVMIALDKECAFHLAELFAAMKIDAPSISINPNYILLEKFGALYLGWEDFDFCLGMDFDAIYITERMASKKFINIVTPALLGRNGKLYSFTSNSEFGKFSITKFKR